MTIEHHPLLPFLPKNAQMLFLGSFPPPKARWCMEFFYPNWINDFWRIQGLVHYDDKHHFEVLGEKRFNLDLITQFCQEQGLAFYDTATKVCRLKDNASDNFLDILEPTDVLALLAEIPLCHTIVTTGGKASEELAQYFTTKGINVEVPKVGSHVVIELSNVSTNKTHDTLTWHRMPSTSRAYPMKIEKKAEYYALLF